LFIHNPLHFVCDLIAFNSALLVLFLFAWKFRNDIRWKGCDIYSILTAPLMIAFLSAFEFANHVAVQQGQWKNLQLPLALFGPQG